MDAARLNERISKFINHAQWNLNMRWFITTFASSWNGLIWHLRIGCNDRILCGVEAVVVEMVSRFVCDGSDFDFYLEDFAYMYADRI